MRLTALLICLSACAWAGCVQGPKVDLRDRNFVQAGGLAVGIELPKREFAVGEQFDVSVVARNDTRRPIAIEATTGALVYLRVLRSTTSGWEEVKRYPGSAVMLMSSWELAPRGTRTFTLHLTVEPDWPTNEPLRLTAELNGKPKVSPGIVVRVMPSSEKT